MEISISSPATWVKPTGTSNDGTGDPFDTLAPAGIGTNTWSTRALASGDFNGDGKLDMIEYVRAVHAAGWDRYICPEVTGQIWKL